MRIGRSPLPTPNLEELVSETARQEFLARQHAVETTVRAHGFDRGNAVLIGGSALAMSGLDSYVALARDASPFDVDAFVDGMTFEDLKTRPSAKALPARRPTEIHLSTTDQLLPTTALITPLCDTFSIILGGPTFAGIAMRANLVRDDILALSPTDTAATKWHRGEPKDFAAIIKAHYIAWHTGHPIVDQMEWQTQVIMSRNSLLRRTDNFRRFARSLPDWLGQLTASRYDHPAFTSLSSSSLDKGQ